MSAHDMPPLPATDYGLAGYDEGGMYEAMGQGYSADEMHAYARAYAESQVRELVEALELFAGENRTHTDTERQQLARALIAKHRGQA